MFIEFDDDFDPNKICLSGQCFRASHFSDAQFRFVSGKHALALSSVSEGKYELDCSETEWDTLWRPYFDFERSYRDIRVAIDPEDDYLLSAAEFGKGIRILRQEPWETLVSFIISQRKSIPAIKTSIERLCRLCGEPINADGTTFFAFPEPEAILRLNDAELQSCGLGYRAPYVRSAAAMVCGGTSLADFSSRSDADLLLALKTFQGVGEKVANCVGLFAFSRLDCAPVDVWIERVIQSRYHGENPFPRYPHNAGVYQQYMFYHAQHTKLP